MVKTQIIMNCDFLVNAYVNTMRNYEVLKTCFRTLGYRPHDIQEGIFVLLLYPTFYTPLRKFSERCYYSAQYK